MPDIGGLFMGFVRLLKQLKNPVIAVAFEYFTYIYDQALTYATHSERN